MIRTARKAKYNNQPCVYKGMRFDSKLELQRFQFLESEQAAGRITDLRHHVPIRIEVNGHFVGTYEADFTYTVICKRFGNPPPATPDARNWIFPSTVEDTKGVQTDLFRFKRRVFEAVFQTCIHIVTKENLTRLPE